MWMFNQSLTAFCLVTGNSVVFLAGEHFPWYPKSLTDIWAGPLKCGDGHVDTDHALQGKVKAFYFSAHWVSSFLLFCLLGKFSCSSLITG